MRNCILWNISAFAWNYHGAAWNIGHEPAQPLSLVPAYSAACRRHRFHGSQHLPPLPYGCDCRPCLHSKGERGKRAGTAERRPGSGAAARARQVPDTTRRGNGGERLEPARARRRQDQRQAIDQVIGQADVAIDAVVDAAAGCLAAAGAAGSTVAGLTAAQIDFVPFAGASTPPRSSAHRQRASAACDIWQAMVRPLFSASAISAAATLSDPSSSGAATWPPACASSDAVTIGSSSAISGSHGSSSCASHWTIVGGDLD